MKQECRKSCFTLVELLVVIAILAVLLSLLTNSLTKLSEMAEQNTCSSRLKQLGTTFAIYAGDYNDSTVSTWNTIANIPGRNPPDHYMYRSVWRNSLVPDYMGGNTKGGPNTYHFKTGWSIDECRKWNEIGVLSCPTALETWGRGDVSAFTPDTNEAWMTGTGTMAINNDFGGYTSGARSVTRMGQIESPAVFAMTFCSSVGWRGNITASATGPYDLQRSGYSPVVGGDGNPVPLMPHGGKYWVWTNQSYNLGYFLDGKSGTLFGDGHVGMLYGEDFPGGSAQFGLRNDISKESRLFWFGYSSDYAGNND